MPQPASRSLISQFVIKIDGQNAPAELMDDLIDIIVDQHLFVPTMFIITLRNTDMKWLERDNLREGKRIEIISVEESRKSLCKGKIASIEANLREKEPTLTVRGYDETHLLHRRKRTRIFKQVKDSDIASQIAGDAGLDSEVEPTVEVFDYILQNNESDFEFLKRRARRIGYEFFIKESKLYFRKPKQDQSEAISLEWGVDLKSFRPRLTTVEQVSEVEVRGWDPAKKREIVGRATRGVGGVKVGETRSGGDVAKEAWEKAKLTIVDQPVTSQREAEELAQAKLDSIASSFIEGEALAFGRGEIQAGRVVELQGLGSRFRGKYYVTAARHTYNRRDGHMVRFTLSRKQGVTVRELIETRSPRPMGQGVVIGIVTNNRDPEGWGRVKVKFPWLEENVESDWARIASPMAGKERGFYYLPEVNDEVLVAFEHGDMRFPYIIGALWNGKDTPIKKNSEVVGSDGKVNQRIIKSRTGHTIILDDSMDKPGISIIDKTGNNKIIIESNPNNMNIEIQGNLTIKAMGTIKMQGNMIEIDGGPMVTVKGGMIKLN